jgi:hypothetical protein
MSLVVLALLLHAAPADVAPVATTPAQAHAFPGVIAWSGMALGGAGLVVAAGAGGWAAAMASIEADPSSSGNDKLLAFHTHSIAGTVALAGIGAAAVGAELIVTAWAVE